MLKNVALIHKHPLIHQLDSKSYHSAHHCIIVGNCVLLWQKKKKKIVHILL